MKARSVLFFVPSTLGYGEAILALDFAKRAGLRPGEAVFVVNGLLSHMFEGSGYPAYWLVGGLPPLNRLLFDDVVREVRPDTIVVVDYLSYQLTRDTVGIGEEQLAATGVPLVDLDIYGRGTGRTVLDRFDGAEPRVVEPDRLDFAATLRPCPLNAPDAPESPGTFAYQAFSEVPRPGRRERMHVRESVGAAPADRVAMLATAPWQHASAGNRRWAGVVVPAIGAMLDELAAVDGVRTLLVHVGPEPLWSSGGPGWDPVWFPVLRQDRFDSLLTASDLHLSLNAISTTLAKAVSCGIPSVLLQSGVLGIDPDDPSVPGWAGEHLPAYRWRMWPVGWFDFLGRLLDGSHYARTFETVEVVDPVAGAATLLDLLAPDGRGADQQREQRLYTAALGALPRPAEWFAAREALR